MTTRTHIKQTQNYQLPTSFSRFLTIIFTLLFLLAGGFVGYLLYDSVKETVASIEVPNLPYIDLSLPSVGNSRPTIGIIPQRGGEIPVTGITGVPLPDYKQKQRVNILLLGIDKRPDEQYARTDTMILVTIDPENKTAGLLSLPRDLWLEIPGYYESRINTAYYLGEKNGYPGGGPALAMKTVQYNFGVPVHFYVEVDFNGFRKIVDTLGGLDVNVPYTLDDPTFPSENYGYDPFHIDAGLQHLDGVTTLKYARTRHIDSDFGRAERQQQVLIAIKDKALQLGLLPKVPELWTTMAGTVETDLQLVDILELANIAPDITADKIETVVLGKDYTVNYTTDAGAMVLLPLREKIQPVIDRMFAQVQTNEASQAEIIAAQAAQATQTAEMQAQQQQREALKTQLQAEGAKIIVQNGTPTEGLDAQTALFLKQQGFNIAQFGTAETTDYPRTVIVAYGDKEYTLGTLVNFFNVAPENVRRSPNLQSDVDLRVIIGADFQLPADSPQSSLILK